MEMKYTGRMLDSQQLTMVSFSVLFSVLWLLVVSLKIRAIIFLHFLSTHQLIKKRKKYCFGICALYAWEILK